MIDVLLKFFLLIIAGCGAIFVSVLTFFMLYVFVPFAFNTIHGLWRYAAGKHKDNE